MITDTKRWATAYYHYGPTIDLESLKENERAFPESRNHRWRIERLVDAAEERALIIERAKVIKAEIEQQFTDAAHWNRTHAGELLVNPDPDGQLKKLLAAITEIVTGN